MADDMDTGPVTEEQAMEEAPATRRPRRGRQILAIIGLVLAGIVVLAGLGLWWLDTDGGRGFVARQIEALQFENGLAIDVEEIDGSIYGEMVLKGVRLSDPEGVFLSSPRIEMDWRPFAFANSHVDIRKLIVPSVRLHRLPQFAETPPSDEPLLPDLDIDVNELRIARFQIDAPVTGQRHVLALDGEAHIADRRAVVTADARALKGPEVAGGDRLALKLDATPDNNRFDIDLSLNGPADGMIAALTGRAAPLELTLDGRGDWTKWDGKLVATSGGANAANLALGARDGTFSVKGNAFPALLGEGIDLPVLSPETSIDLVARLDERKADIDATLGNGNFSITADGLVDLAESRFGGLKVDFRLPRPASIAEALTGAGISGGVVLDGPMATPIVAYRMTAARLGFDGTVVEGLVASGEARVDADTITIPLSARARRITGLNAAAGELLTNVRLDGDLAIQGARILSDNIRVRSDRIDATAIVVADLDTGLYTGALKGRLNGYKVDGFGTFNVETALDLKTRNSDFSIEGQVRARSTRLTNSGVADFLGGNGVMSATIRYGGDGSLRFNRLRVSAPDFRMTDGSGSMSADGQIRFSGRGSSGKYGALAVNLSGTIDNPNAELALSNPDFGIGLADLRATVRGRGGRYDAKFTGATDYGSLAGDVSVATGRGPLDIDIRRVAIAELAFAGRLRQTAAGPFAGSLTALGNGVDGDILLSAEGQYQRAKIDLVAADADFPGAAGLTIGRAIIDADVILYDRPQAVADVQLASTNWGELYVAAARAKVDYRGGSGTAKILAEGRNQVPFRVAANAAMTPELWRVALKGRANGIDFATVKPARIEPVGASGYRLLPTFVDLERGRLELAGELGEQMVLQSRLNDVDISIANVMMPGLGLGGTATGSLDFSQAGSGFPSADARLRINNFTRSSLASVSQPVDVHLVGRLLPEGGNMRAIIRRKGTVIGRMQADLKPLPPGAGPWMERLMNAPLSGGIRYNGPANTLFSLAALPDQSLKGAIGVAADFSGRLQRPQLTGVVRANNLVYENDTYGTRLTEMKLRGRFTNDRLEVTELTAVAGDGRVSANGFVSLSSAEGFPIQLDLDLDNARLARGSDLAATATGKLSIVNGPSQPPTITGKLRLPETRYRIVREGSVKVATLTGIRRKPVRDRPRITGDPDPIDSLPSNWRLNVDVYAEEQIYVSGMGLDSEWSADLQLRGTTGAPQIGGRIELVRGNLSFAGRSFELTTGLIQFVGNNVTNPNIRLVATGEADDVTVNVNVAGSAENPQITFSSTPSLPQDEIMARILFGNSIGELSAIQAVQLAASLNSLRGGSGGLNPLGVLQSSAGIDRIRLLGADEETGRGTSVAVGQYITNDVYVEIVTDTRGYTATQLEVSLTPALSVLSSFGSFGGSELQLQYRKDY